MKRGSGDVGSGRIDLSTLSPEDKEALAAPVDPAAGGGSWGVVHPSPVDEKEGRDFDFPDLAQAKKRTAQGAAEALQAAVVADSPRQSPPPPRSAVRAPAPGGHGSYVFEYRGRGAGRQGHVVAATQRTVGAVCAAPWGALIIDAQGQLWVRYAPHPALAAAGAPDSPTSCDSPASRADSPGPDAPSEFQRVALPPHAEAAVDAACGAEGALVILRLIDGREPPPDPPVPKTRPRKRGGVLERIQLELERELKALLEEKWDTVWKHDYASQSYSEGVPYERDLSWHTTLSGPVQTYLEARKGAAEIEAAREVARSLAQRAENAGENEQRIRTQIRKKQAKVAEEKDHRRKLQLKDELRKMLDLAALERDAVEQWQESVDSLKQREEEHSRVLAIAKSRVFDAFGELVHVPLCSRYYSRWLRLLCARQRSKRLALEERILMEATDPTPTGGAPEQPARPPPPATPRQPSAEPAGPPPPAAEADAAPGRSWVPPVVGDEYDAAERSRQRAHTLDFVSGRPELLPVRGMRTREVVKVECGPQHGLMLCADGAWCTGVAADGRLGGGDAVVRHTGLLHGTAVRALLPEGPRLTLLGGACGARHTLALARPTHADGRPLDAEVWGWGWAGDGQLGRRVNGEVRAPIRLDWVPQGTESRVSSSIRAVRAAGRCSLIWREDGIFVFGGGAPPRRLDFAARARVTAVALGPGSCIVATEETEEYMPLARDFGRSQSSVPGPATRLWAMQWRADTQGVCEGPPEEVAFSSGSAPRRRSQPLILLAPRAGAVAAAAGAAAGAAVVLAHAAGDPPEPRRFNPRLMPRRSIAARAPSPPPPPPESSPLPAPPPNCRRWLNLGITIPCLTGPTPFLAWGSASAVQRGAEQPQPTAKVASPRRRPARRCLGSLGAALRPARRAPPDEQVEVRCRAPSPPPRVHPDSTGYQRPTMWGAPPPQPQPPGDKRAPAGAAARQTGWLRRLALLAPRSGIAIAPAPWDAFPGPSQPPLPAWQHPRPWPLLRPSGLPQCLPAAAVTLLRSEVQ
eukprot:TRINITY_DN7794_c0_g1_i1.p1 TRINITY_DN7794_c0_g1~~TRINITY_DN7794_c0_g1_i1.p1  ORF type:complete len:1055 (+),score=249.00 TRINITY_DN7794_c0_g1_i1:72-3167(+)